MKKIIFLTLISLCVYAFIHAETEKELFDTGVLLFKQGQYQAAIDSFSKLIEIKPDNADAYKNRGVSYMKQEKFDQAIKDFQKAKELFPELKGLYSNLGVAWYYKKEYQKAINNYNIEIEMAPENPVAYFNRALCLAELNRNSEALDDLAKTLIIQPDFYWAICYKADLLALEGDDAKAAEAYEEAIKQDSKNTYAIKQLSRLRQKLKEEETLKTVSAIPVETPRKKSGYALQAGAFLNHSNADRLKIKLMNHGFDSSVLILKDSSNRMWYLVRVGNYDTHSDAKEASLSLKNKLDIKSIVRPAGDW